MKFKYTVILFLLTALFISACTSEEPDPAEPQPSTPTAETGESAPTAAPTSAVDPTTPPESAAEPTPEPTETAVLIPPATLPTADAPTGTVLEPAGDEILLSHPTFSWRVTLPADWIITYDTGFQLEANSPDQAVLVHVQAQRWETAESRPPNAQAYVDHWKNFTYGDIFPLYADGEQLAETEVAPDKFGGPYLQYEFLDSEEGLHYLQIYASAGGPASAMISVWTAEDNYDAVQALMEAILASFELMESGE